jgi:hypothetical protein
LSFNLFVHRAGTGWSVCAPWLAKLLQFDNL